MAETNPDTIISRNELLKDVRRAVIKAGSGILTGRDGLNKRVISNLSKDICELRKTGVEVILVSSGAIASGLKKLGLARRPESLSQKQAVAALGQSSLMMAYEKAFGRHGQKVAQILLTRDDLNNRERYLNARNTLFALLAWNIVPIINENDTVAVDEIKFGDNDNLSAMVTSMSESRLLVNLTNIAGLYDRDPRTNKDARLIPVVEKVDNRVRRYANSIPGFLGTGGMASKIRAAQRVALAGVPTIIANGRSSGILRRIFMGKEEGTLFLPEKIRFRRRKHWIAFTKSPKGEIVIDHGAERAVIVGCKSLLPSGIKQVKGRFNLGDSVLLLNEENRELAVGLVNYHSGDVTKIMGLKSEMIEAILGYKHDDEVIHRDNMVITLETEEGEDLCRLRD